MKLRLDKEDTNNVVIKGVNCLFEFNHRSNLWEGWISGSDDIVFTDKKPENIYRDLQNEIKSRRTY